MIYRCYYCGNISFSSNCVSCRDESNKPNLNIPLDPAYFPEFQYKTEGFVKDIFWKKKKQGELSCLLDEVLIKYSELKNPYFVNFINISNYNPEEFKSLSYFHDSDGGKVLSEIELFHAVLVRQGFKELKDNPLLLNKLLMVTMFASEYYGFSRELEKHIKSTVDVTLKSWIQEVGNGFYHDLPLFLYFFYESKQGSSVITYNREAENVITTPLISSHELDKWEKKATFIYNKILVDELDSKLKNFDPTKYVTIYYVDSLNGFQFEEFLVTLFQTIGYDVKSTRKTGDQGADLFVERFGRKTVIQAKNYSGKVGNSSVQQALSAKAFYNCDDAMVVTNSFFTKSAIELASSASVKLIDRDELSKYLEEFNQQLIEIAEFQNGNDDNYK